MPDTTYMLVDRRHDHSMRVPRPDLTVTLGVPNACSRCHTDRTSSWAADAVQRWYGRSARSYQTFATAFAADDAGEPGAPDSLLRVARDARESHFARASAVARLGMHPGPQAMTAATAAARSPDPSMRRAALRALEHVDPPLRRSVGLPLLADSLRAIRQAAAWVLAPLAGELSASDARTFELAYRELVQSLRYNADRAASRLTLGALYVMRDRLDSAIVEFQAAARLTPSSPDPHVNLAEVYLRRGRPEEARAAARAALSRDPGDQQAAAILRGLPPR
jgi:tetratricopeptide (TPR) repeat protein